MRILIAFVFVFAFFPILYSQETNLPGSASHDSYCNVIGTKFQRINKRLFKATKEALDRSEKAERRIYRKLLEQDTISASIFLSQLQEHYQVMRKKLEDAKNGLVEKELKEYNKYFDTIKTTLTFLHLNSNTLPDNVSVSAASGQLKSYETLLQTSNEIKRQLAKHSKELTARLSPFGLSKQLNRLNRESYALKQQLDEYKNLLKDRKKIENLVLSKLRDNNTFAEFFKSNSILSKMFQLPGRSDVSLNQNLQGLQTIASVQAQINQQFGSAAVDPQQYVNQQVSFEQNQINQLKAKLNKVKAGSNSDPEMHEGYNSQRGKSFFKRLSYETNFQTQRQQVTMTDASLMIGYKINDRSVVSFGASARLGLGKNWNNIRFTNEGFGLRSVLDWKLKHSLWITGSYETNYFRRFDQVQYNGYVDPWQANILLGLMKKIKVNSKKSSTVRLAYNLLHKESNFLTQPIVFRVGYGF